MTRLLLLYSVYFILVCASRSYSVQKKAETHFAEISDFQDIEYLDKFRVVCLCKVGRHSHGIQRICPRPS